jgi:UDP-N-acetylglucosamine 3-dehydrogenase
LDAVQVNEEKGKQHMVLKAAVIGVGSIGHNHARIYDSLPDVELVWVHDSDAKTAETIGERYNTRFGTDLNVLLDENTPDLVSVSVPTIYHFPVAKETLSRGIHTLIEKPIAHTIEEADELIALAKEKSVRLMVGHIERFNPAIRALKERLDEGAIGEVFRAQARRMSPFPARIRDVGVAVDLSTHDIDILRMVIGSDIVRAYAETAHVITEHEDMVDATLGFENGVGATLNTSRLTPTKIRELTVHGTQGMFHVNYLTQELILYHNGNARSDWDSLKNLGGVGEGDVLKIAIPKQEPLKAELAHFVECVRDNSAPLVSGEDGKKALAVALAIIEAGKTHQVVTL